VRALAVIVNGLRLPFDLLFLTFDFLRYTAWTLRQIPVRREGMLGDPYPPCVGTATPGEEGDKELPCTLARKYGNPVLLCLLFPGISATRTPSGRRIWTWKPDSIRAPTTVPRYLGVAALLAVLWAGVGLGVLACLLPRSAPDSGPSPIPRRAATAPATALAPDAQPQAPRIAAADQLLAAKSWSEARQAYADILKADPTNPDVAVGKGRAALELGYLDEARACFAAVLAASPRHPGALLASATLYARTGTEAKAVDALTLLLAAAPDNHEAQALLAECYRRQGRLDEALATAATALQATPTDRDVILTTARTYLQKQDLDQAAALFAKAVELDPRDPGACLEQADLLRRQGKLAAWESAVEALLKRFPDELSVVAARVDAYMKQGNAAKALELCKAVTTRHPDYYRLRELHAALLLSVGRRDDAYLTATALLRDQPGNGAAHLQLAALFLQGGVPSLAEEHCRKAIAQGSATPDAYRLLAKACMDRGDWAGAMDQFKTLLRTAPNDPTLLVGLAKCQSKAGRRDEAIGTLKQAHAKHPQSTPVLAELGNQQSSAGEQGEALAAFRKAHDLDPSDWSIQNNLAVLLTHDGKELDAAIGLAHQAFEQAPGNPHVADTLGWLHVLRGEYAQASPLLAVACAAPETGPQAVYHYAELKSRMGDREAALRLARQAVATGIDFPELEPAKQLLRQLEKSAPKGP
jgi:tetratricopeptide (TPR) repeat protein